VERDLAHGAGRGGFHRLNQATAANVKYEEKMHDLRQHREKIEVGLRQGMRDSLAEVVVAGDGHRRFKQAQAATKRKRGNQLIRNKS
jgi:hypothetical protein